MADIYHVLYCFVCKEHTVFVKRRPLRSPRRASPSGMAESLAATVSRVSVIANYARRHPVSAGKAAARGSRGKPIHRWNAGDRETS